MGENPTACWALSHLFDRLYFLPTVLCATLIAISLTLGALLFEQSYNILKNITTNERLNGSRYPWMTDNLGNPFNRFDRGFANNFLEFWCAPGYCKDYYNEFGDPPPPKSIESFELLPLVSGGNLNLSMRRDSVDSNMSGLDPLKGRSDAFSPPVPNLHHSDSASACDYEHPLQSFPRFRQFPTYPTTHMTKPLSYDQSGLVSPSDLFVQEDPAFVGVQNGFSILTRAQEAQLQFEARVQHAIEMSHSPRDAHTDGGLESPTSSGPPQDGGSLHWGHIPKHDSDMFKEPIRGSGSGDALRSISAVSQDELTNVFSHQLLLSKGNNTQQNFAVHSREMHQPHPMSISAVEIALGPDSNPHTPVPPRRYGSSGSAEGRSFERSLLQTERPSTTPTYLPHQEKKHFRAPIVDDNSSLGPQGAAATVFTQLQPGGDRAERSADLCKITDSQRHFLTDDGQEGHFVGKEG